MDISLIASSVRPHLWGDFFKSLEGNDCEWEVVFSGDIDAPQYDRLKYIKTLSEIPPTQCYEIARREATGKYVLWVADDCEFSTRLLDMVVSRMDSLPYKTLLSLKTNEDGKDNDLDDHRFFGFNKNCNLMAPLGCINREYLSTLGGFDRRFCCGQYENQVAQMVWHDGGKVIKYEDVCVCIEHIKKHGVSTKFWTQYDYDRKVLEDSWCVGGYKPQERCITIFDQSKKPQFFPYFPITNREVSKEPILGFDPFTLSTEELTRISECPIKWGK